MKTFCYHTRDTAGKKLTGGMLHADSFEDAASRAAAGHVVGLTGSGSPRWIDKSGREIWLYLSVCPDQVPRGRAEIERLTKERRAEREAAAKAEREKEERLSALIASVGIDNALVALAKMGKA